MSALEMLSRRAVRHVRPVTRSRATGLVAQVYAQMEREFQLAPPLTVHSPVPPLLAAVWAASRETLVVGEARLTKEAIASAVSSVNECPYCVDVHSVMLAAGDQGGVADALGKGEIDRIEDPELGAAVRFALDTLQPDARTTRAPPFAREALPAFAGTAVVFHFINRVVNVFMREGSPLALPGAIRWMRAPMAKLAARTVGRSILAARADAGSSAVLLAPSPPSGIGWIDSHPTIGPALSALFHVSRAGVEGLVSPATVQALDGLLSQWRGERPPLGRAWLDAELDRLPRGDRAGARLMLLSARAAYQVSDGDVAEFRSAFPDDSALVRIVAFGASAAARRVASWIAPEVRS